MVGPRGKPDLYDAGILAGFASLVAGIAWMSKPAALIIGGILVIGYCLYGSGTKGEGR